MLKKNKIKKIIITTGNLVPSVWKYSERIIIVNSQFSKRKPGNDTTISFLPISFNCKVWDLQTKNQRIVVGVMTGSEEEKFKIILSSL